MKILLNGSQHDVTGAPHLEAAVISLGKGCDGMAAALNGEVVPRARWSATVLSEGDRVEVLTASQGG